MNTDSRDSGEMKYPLTPLPPLKEDKSSSRITMNERNRDYI
jgi:hypothetical protein